jgi:hypothetical protein
MRLFRILRNRLRALLGRAVAAEEFQPVGADPQTYAAYYPALLDRLRVMPGTPSPLLAGRSSSRRAASGGFAPRLFDCDACT